MRPQKQKLEGGMRGLVVHVIATVLLTILCLVQLSASAAAQITFEKTYGGPDFDWGYSIQQTSDGGYVISGHTKSFGSGAIDVYLVRTDSLGNTLWDSAYGAASEDNQAYCVQQTVDGGFITAGSQGWFEDMYLVRVDPSGSELWTRTYGGIWHDGGRYVQQTSDGAFVAVGWVTPFSGWDYDVYLVKIDSAGNMLWDELLGGDRDDYGYSVELTTDGGYIVVGYTHSFGAGSTDVYLAKTDSLGKMIWQRSYGGKWSDYGTSVQQTLDGGYIVVGHTKSLSPDSSADIYLIRTDSLGESIWQKYLGGGESDSGWSVLETSDGGFMIAGETESYGHGSADVWILKTDMLGNLLWTRTYGGTWGDHAYCLRQTSDGGYIVAGWTRSFGAGYYDVYVIKTDEDGNVAVEEQLQSPAIDGNTLNLEVYPNPCFGSAKIHYSLPTSAYVNISVYDVSGRLVTTLRDGQAASGIYSEMWDAGNLPSGSYVCRVAVEGSVETEKVIVLSR